MKLTSSAFTSGGAIPSRYTCDAEDVNPPLMIVDVPTGAKSLALIVDDPDAPRGLWTHWTVWNIDPATVEISEQSVPAGAIEGLTSFGRVGWGGPCPGSGSHRYYFRLYALDAKLDSLPADSPIEPLRAAMNGHILAEAELMGRYERLRR